MLFIVFFKANIYFVNNLKEKSLLYSFFIISMGTKPKHAYTLFNYILSIFPFIFRIYRKGFYTFANVRTAY